MSKKGGTIVKIVAVVAGIAAVGTACYVYKDKIIEFFQKLKLKEKVDSVKSFVDENVLGKKDDDYFDDADFFDDDDSDAVADRETGNRGYTSITITTDDSEEKPAEEADDEPVKAESEDAPQSTEAAKAADAETDVEEYENEGLSDTSEDEDALADEAALDGASPEEI